MAIQHALVYAAAALTLAANAVPHVAQVAARARLGGTQVLVRSGSWRGGEGEQGRWRVRAEHDRGAGSLRGEVTVDGSRSITRARLDGRLTETSLRGALKDDGGRVLARLEGKVRGESISGRFVTSDGDRGTWSTP